MTSFGRNGKLLQIGKLENVAMTQIEAIEISRNYVHLLRFEGISVDKAFLYGTTCRILQRMKVILI